MNLPALLRAASPRARLALAAGVAATLVAGALATRSAWHENADLVTIAPPVSTTVATDPSELADRPPSVAVVTPGAPRAAAGAPSTSTAGSGLRSTAVPGTAAATPARPAGSAAPGTSGAPPATSGTAPSTAATTTTASATSGAASAPSSAARAGSTTTTRATTTRVPTPAPPTTARPAGTTPPPTAAPPTSPPATAAPTTTAAPPTTAPPTTAAPPGGVRSTGWKVTVYITPLDTNYPGGGTTAINGCERWCPPSPVRPLGTYTNDFLAMVRVQGAGQVTSGPYAGWYLQYSSAAGYWVSPDPLAANGDVLVPFASAAASSALSFGNRFTITDCGRNTYGGTQDAAVCARFRSVVWTVTDRFDSGGEAARHLDLYLGVEVPGQRFADSPYYQAWDAVVLDLS